MSFYLTPIATALAILVSHSAYADGGVIGSNGASYGVNTSLIGDVQYGDVGVANSNDPNGGDALGVKDQMIIVGNEIGGQTVITGDAGAPGETVSKAGAGAGGQGGASVIGGISIGGAAGSTYSPLLSANGGDGGNVSANKIEITNSTLIGAAAGEGGGITDPISEVDGGGGVGGNGGGSVFGGISTGGAAGYSFSASSFSANGGNGGDVSANSIEITNSTLTGATAGAGGSITRDTSNNERSYAAGGAAGHGGGSVFGGISTGGAAGYSRAYTIAPSSGGNGGDGGNVSENKIEITNSTLIGAAAGAGGSLTVSPAVGGAGAAGHGGGSVFGGISTGGAAGTTSTSGVTSANGGNGGHVTGNQITLTKVNSDGSGAAGGAGGSVAALSSTSPFTSSAQGGGGAAGHGGGSVFGGISTGGAAGSSGSNAGISANGGNGGNVSENKIEITYSTLTGAAAGAGGSVTASGAAGGGGAAGHGGGSVFGGISNGGAAGSSYIAVLADLEGQISSSANGGNGGNVSRNKIEITNSTLTGAAAGAGGSITAINQAASGAGGAAGHGGGSVFGGISTGGAAGSSGSNAVPASLSNGGNGGDVSANSIEITNSTLTGAAAGAGGGITTSSSQSNSSSYGGGGAAGHGGGSVFGGISTGGAAGSSGHNAKYGSSSSTSSNGGNGGNVSANSIQITNSTLTGAAAGAGGSITSLISSYGGGGAAGHGGGSVFGGISTGGAAGYSFSPDSEYGAPSSSSTSANGGNGGNVSANTIEITNSTLAGTAAGAEGIVTPSSSSYGGDGAKGYAGGSVFGGISTGGAGGYSRSDSDSSLSSNGGNGGNVSDNKITISGVSKISGSIYGGISQGGAKGKVYVSGSVTDGIDGKGGLAKNNTISIIGDNVSIEGSIFGGLSINGDGEPNKDTTYSSYYSGNTLQIQSGHVLLKESIQNFQNYNWLLPEYELNGGIIITVDPTTGIPVDINNTIHSVDVQATGNVLEGGDQVTLITKVTGQPALKSRMYIEQGFFIVYDAEMVVQQNAGAEDSLVLNVLGIRDNNPDGTIHPESEEFLKGRIAQLAMIDQGADMISDGISYARASLREENANIFAIVDGGSSKYKNGGVSTLKLNDFKFALGAAKAFEFENKSVGMIAAFAEHGNGNYNSYNYFDYFEDTRGSGKVRYSGFGLMGHLDVADTDVSEVKNKPNIFDEKYGLYLDTALRVGHVKVDFHSADMVKGQGIEARYNTKSRYASAMLGAGYVWTLDEKSAMDFYGRFTFSRMNGKDIQVVDEQMNAGPAHSKRLRLGARYGYAYSATTTPYAGVAFERNFTGDVTGSAYGFTIKETSLKGNTGIVEAGVMIKPKGADDPFSLRLGVQGHFGQRKGATADIRARYVF